MQAEENSDSDDEEGQTFYAGGSERRYKIEMATRGNSNITYS